MTSRRGVDGTVVDIWSNELRQEYINFIQSKKELSKASIHSYCWRLETLFKALAHGTEFQGTVLNKEVIRQLVVGRREEAERIVRQDDRQSHYRLLKEFLSIPDGPAAWTPAPLAPTLDGSNLLVGADGGLSDQLLGPKPTVGLDYGSAVTGNARGKVWDANLKRDYTNWLKERGVKERTCGSYCTYVHNLLRALAERRKSGPLADDGCSFKKENLSQEDVKDLLTEEAEEAARLVRQSKKARYLRSFKEFLGMRTEGKPPRGPANWVDRMCAEYKCWLEKEGDERVGVIRSKAYVGASRAMLRSVKRNNWMGEQGAETKSREELRACLLQYTKELEQELGERADPDRLGKFLGWLQTPPMAPGTFNDYLIISDDEEDGGEDGSEVGERSYKRRRETGDGVDDYRAKIERLENEKAGQQHEIIRLREHIKTIRQMYDILTQNIQNGVPIHVQMLPDFILEPELTQVVDNSMAGLGVGDPSMGMAPVEAVQLGGQVAVTNMPMASTTGPTLVDMQDVVSVSMAHTHAPHPLTHSHGMGDSLDLDEASEELASSHQANLVNVLPHDGSHLLSHDDVPVPHDPVHVHHDDHTHGMHHHHHDPHQHHHLGDTHHLHHHHHHHHEHDPHQHMEVEDPTLEQTVLEEVHGVTL